LTKQTTINLVIGGTFENKSGCLKEYKQAIELAVRIANEASLSGELQKHLPLHERNFTSLRFIANVTSYPEQQYGTLGQALTRQHFRGLDLIIAQGIGCNLTSGLHQAKILRNLSSVSQDGDLKVQHQILMSATSDEDISSLSPDFYTIHRNPSSLLENTVRAWAFERACRSKSTLVRSAAIIYIGNGHLAGRSFITVNGSVLHRHTGLHTAFQSEESQYFTQMIMGESTTGGASAFQGGGVQLLRKQGISVVSLESYSPMNLTIRAAEGMVQRAFDAAADVLVLAAGKQDGKILVAAISNAKKKMQRFKGIWASGAADSDGGCYGLHGRVCNHFVGAAEFVFGTRDHFDPVLNSTSQFIQRYKQNQLGKIQVPSFLGFGPESPRLDIASMISFYAQAAGRVPFCSKLRSGPGLSISNSDISAEFSKHLSQSVAVHEGQTIVGPLAFDNKGRLASDPPTIQLVYDDQRNRSVAKQIFPLVEASMAMNFPSPATRECEDWEVRRVRTAGIRSSCILCSVCHSCLPGRPALDKRSCENIVEEKHLLGPSVKVVGFLMFGLNCSLVIYSLCWTLQRRKSPLVRRAQPIFLALIGVGCIISSGSILAMLVDEGVTDDQALLDRACMAQPWLYCVGFVLTFSSLYAKVWRVKKIFMNARLRRLQIKNGELLKWICVALLVESIPLIAWQLMDPLKWSRSCTKFDPVAVQVCTESQGSCSSERGWSFMIPILFLHIFVLIRASLLAHQIRNVATDFQESKWIGIAIFSDLQLLLLGLPVVYLVRSNPIAYFVVKSGIVFINDGGDAGFIFIPKIIRSWKEIKRGKYSEDLGDTSVSNLSKNSLSTRDTANEVISQPLRPPPAAKLSLAPLKLYQKGKDAPADAAIAAPTRDL